MSVQLIEAAAALGQGLQVREGPREAAVLAAILAAVAEPVQLPAAVAVRPEPQAAEPGPADQIQEAQEAGVDNARTS